MVEHEDNDSVVHNNNSGEGATACAAKDEPITQESDTSPTNQSFTVSEEEWTGLKTSLDKRYTEIATLLRYNKTKDESIQRLSDEIQTHRDGFAFDALKPSINALIAFREDCRKSIRDAEKSPPDDEKVKKFIRYLVSDFEEMLANIGLERADGSISINGRPLSGLPEPKETSIEPPVDEQKKEDSSQTLTCAGQIKSMSELIEYLDLSVAAIRSALQDRMIVDKTIQGYIAREARTDAVHYFALVAPVSKQLYKLYDSISAKSQSADSCSGDALIKLYSCDSDNDRGVLEDVVNGIEDILTDVGVVIETLDDVFDPQKHKLLKTIPTNDEKLDRVINNKYTDCYTYDGKVIYPSKVDVYKFQQ